MHSETVHLNHSKSFVFRCSVMSDSLHPWTLACQAPRSMEFSSPESWSGEPFPPPGNLPNPGITPMSLCPLNWQEDSLPLAPLQFSSVEFSCSVMSKSLWPYEPQHTRPPCPSPTPGVYSNSSPLSWWYHPAILGSTVNLLASFSSLCVFAARLLFIAKDGQERKLGHMV